MTEDVMIFNFDFEGVGEIDEPSHVIIKDFGQFQLAAFRKVTLFVKGATLTVPEIMVNGEPFSRKGMKEGGKTSAYFFVRKGEKQDGSEFTEVRIFTSVANIPLTKKQVDNLPVPPVLSEYQKAAYDKDETVWMSDWVNMQTPAIQMLPKEQAALIGRAKPFWGSADNWNTGRKPNVVAEGTEEEKKYYERFWYNFTFYTTKEEMVAAREAHFASLNGNSATAVNYPVSPVDWTGQEDGMLAWVKSELAAGKDLKETAKLAGLISGAKDKDGNAVNHKTILASILGIPEPMVQV